MIENGTWYMQEFNTKSLTINPLFYQTFDAFGTGLDIPEYI